MAEPKTFEVDFTDVEEFAPIARNVAKGNYVLRVVKIAVPPKGSKSSGNKMWVVDSEFVDGKHRGEQIREHLTFTEKSLFKVKSWLGAVLGQAIPKRKMKLPNTEAELNKRFVGKLYGAHVDDGDPYVNAQGETVTKSEIKYHLFAKDVESANAAPDPEAVTESTPDEPEEPEQAEEAVAEDESEKASGDVADQLEDFDLDNL